MAWFQGFETVLEKWDRLKRQAPKAGFCSGFEIRQSPLVESIEFLEEDGARALAGGLSAR
jgi:hypothetical protein